MDGLMMDYPLTLQHFLERAGRLFPKKEIVTRTPSGTHRYHYQDYYRRTQRLARVLDNLGVKPGDRVIIQAWEVWPGALDQPHVASLVDCVAEKCLVAVRRYGSDLAVPYGSKDSVMG